MLENVAAIYLDLGEVEKASALYEEAIRLSETEGEPGDAALGLIGLAAISDLRAEPLNALI